jgi:hypothetical protein
MHKQQCDSRWIMVGNHNTMKIKVKVHKLHTFKVIKLTLPPGNLGTIASLIAVTRYQGNPY